MALTQGNSSASNRVLRNGDTMLGTLNTQTLLPATTATYSLGASGNYYTSLFAGTINPINATSINMPDGGNMVVGSTTGTKIGTATTQKLGFFNATPVVQGTATADIGTVMSDLGLRAAGSAYQIVTNGASVLNGSNRYGVTNRTTSLVLTATTGRFITCDASSNAVQITLFATTTSGYMYTIKRTDASVVNTVTVIVASSGTIDGQTTITLPTQYKYITVVSTAVSGVWLTVGNN